MDQQAQLSAIAEKFASEAPEFVKKIAIGYLETLKTTFDPNTAVQPGSQLPDFTLSDALGNQVSSAALLSKGPVLLTFYRGSWCPYCNVAVSFLQKYLADFEARGVQLAAVTPELPDNTLSTREKLGLKFHVLTDRGNGLGRKLGIVHSQSELRSYMEGHGIDLKKSNGDDSYEMSLPATLLVDGNGIVRNVYVDPDFRNRLDPKVALEWIDNMSKE